MAKPGKIRLAMILALAGTAMAIPARAGDAGLPQLDTAMFPEQLFWLAICFVALYLLMSRVAMPRIEKTQGNRHNVIAGECAAAHAAHDAAKTGMAQVEKSLADARAKAQASVGEMIAKVAEEAAARQSAQERQLVRRLHEAEEKIAVTREAALKAVQASATDLAASVVEKVIGRKMRVGA